MKKARILIVEDEFVTRMDIKNLLTDIGYDVIGAVSTGENAVIKAGELQPDIVLMDITLQGEMNGITAAAIIKEKYLIPVIFLTAHSDEQTVQSAKVTEPFGYIIKPYESRNLIISIEMALYKHMIDAELRASEERYRALAERSDDAILIINENFSINYINTFGTGFFYPHKEDPISKNILDIFPDKEALKLKGVIESVFKEKNQQRFSVESIIRGHKFWLDISLIPLTQYEDQVSSVMVIVRDITFEIELRRKMEKDGLQLIEKQMEQFQILNDQIRNPLQVITLLVSDKEDSAPFNQISKQVEIIDELVSKLDRGWIESEKVHSFLLRHYCETVKYIGSLCNSPDK